ncbi:phasin family protein [Massilia sp. CFBP9012]|uniref:phasin family protein n=1 Tax=Massilia sp. CFBP9012 TaxID=3096531 RepID=UPI002A6B35AE|nr:phasin family protein [Massilia sp. CFBP9012]MDY0978007.1 phasin family protein [Massilia sp. CFBP9012]
MTSLPEQLSAASTRQLSAQLDAQFRFFNTFATQALDNASRLVSLNLSASRDSVERSSHTLRQLIGATQPQDLLVLRTHAEEQVRSLLNYSRELANITANAQPYGLRTIAPQAASPAVVAPVVQKALISEAVQEAPKEAIQTAEKVTGEVTGKVPEKATEQIKQAAEQIPEPAAAPEPFVVAQAEPIATAAEVQSTVLEEPVPVSEQKPIAKAAGKGASKAAAVPQPLAAPVEDKDSATVTRIGTSSKRRK